MARSRESLQEGRKVLVRAPNWIGDVVMSIPALIGIKSGIPAAEICILAKPWVADILQSSPAVDRIIFYESPGIHQGLVGKLRLAKRLREEKFDLSILLPNSFESALITYLARIPQRAGYNTDGRGLLLTHPVPAVEKKKGHQIDYYLKLVKSLGFPAQRCLPFLRMPSAQMEKVRLKMKMWGISSQESLVGLTPGSSFGPAKQWFAEKFASLSTIIQQRLGAKILILGSQKDQGVSKKIIQQGEFLGYDLTGQTKLTEAMAIIAQCRLLITNDSGLMHVAAALQVPLVAIFGSTDPAHTGPIGEHCCIIKKNIPCSPCFKQKCPKNMECMEAISVEEVYAAVERLWFFSTRA